MAAGLSSIGRWLGDGYRLFSRSRGVSMGYAALFVLPGLALEYGLLAMGYGLYYFILAAGFVLIAPFLFAPYARLASQGAGAGGGLFRLPPVVWVIGVVCGALFLIWVTDAFIIYSVYFGFQPLPDLFAGGETSSRAMRFLGYAALLGLVLSLVTLFVTTYSIPSAIHQGHGLVDAIVFNAGCAWHHPGLVLLWGLLLAVCMLTILLLALPLGLVVFPVLAYANFSSYRELAALRENNS